MNTFKIIIIVFISISIFTLERPYAQNLSALKSQLKGCNDESCKKALQQESEHIFHIVGKHFNNNFSQISNDISITHCQSIINEIFFHMSKLKPYYNYKDVFLLKKLKQLKEYRDKYDQKKIDSTDFQRLVSKTEKQHNHDLEESQEYIDEKVGRMLELCENLRDNLDAIDGQPGQKGSRLPYYLKSKITVLQSNPTWQEFEQRPKESKKIRSAILLASNHSGNKLIPKLESIFSTVASSTGGIVFPKELINRLIQTYARH